MGWFKQHLNWTLFIALYGPFVPIIILEKTIGIEGLNVVISGIAYGVLLLSTCIWYLRQKGKSLSYLLLFLAGGIGWIAFFFIPNKEQEEEIKKRG